MRTIAPRRRHQDDGFSLVYVMLITSVVMILVATSVAATVSVIKPSRATADSQAAMAAAQTGIDDFISRLNSCDGYWKDAWVKQTAPTSTAPRSCPSVPHNPALNGWNTITGADGLQRAEFSYKLIATPDNGGNRIRLEAKGRVNGSERSLTADLSKAGFLKFIYYTDKESSDPDYLSKRYGARTVSLTRAACREIFGNTASQCPTSGNYVNQIRYPGISATEADKCGRYWYDAAGQVGRRAASTDPTNFAANNWSESLTYYWSNGTTQSTTNRAGGCEIQFVAGDKISGHLYTKDGMLLSGNGPEFQGTAETYWQSTYTPAARTAKPWRENGAGAGPSPAGQTPRIASASVDMPSTNAKIRVETDPANGRNNCRYTGPTRIRLLASGGYQVTSPRSTNSDLPANCGVGLGAGTTQTVTGPANGVIFVDAFSGTCTEPSGTSNRIFGVYPETGDITQYSCRGGDAYVQGTLNGRLTIATDDRIIVTGDTTYASGTSQNGDDVLGLVAGRGNVEIYHPVKCATGSVGAGGMCPDDTSDSPGGNASDHATSYDNLSTSLDEITVHAAILSVDHSFTVQNYDKGEQLDYLHVFGGIYQRHRGAVGSNYGSGRTGYSKDYVYDTRLVTYPPPSFLPPENDPWLLLGLSEDQ